MRKIVLFLITYHFISYGDAQVGINNPFPDSSAVLDMSGSANINRGVLFPKMTTSDRLSISLPANGLTVMDTTIEKLFFFDATPPPGSWIPISDLSRHSNRIDYYLGSGKLGIGSTNPQEKLDVNGNISVDSIKVPGFSTNPLVPSGIIVMWSGTTPPNGWVMCDGNNGTPDLQAKFIVAWDSPVDGPPRADYANPGTFSEGGTTKGTTGGLEHVTLTHLQSGLPEHNHEINDPGHSHAFVGTQSGIGGIDMPEIGQFSIPIQTVNTSTETTGISVENVSAQDAIQSHENRPPYYVLAFIMKL